MDTGMCRKCGMIAAALGVSVAFAAERTTDWSKMSGEITIPAGETWYAEESDMAKVNELTSITLSSVVTGDGSVEAATLVFRDTTTVPKADLLKGAGVVRKTGLSVWGSYGNPQTGFTGDWHLDGGVVTNVASGAYRDLHIKGSGNLLVPRALVLAKIATAGVRYLYLDGDATIETGPDHYWLSDQGGSGGTKKGKLFLGNNTLT